MNLTPGAISTIASRLRDIATELDDLLRTEPVVEHPSFDAPALPANPAVSVIHPGAWQYVRLTNEYKLFASIIGPNKIRCEADWMPWARILTKYKSEKRNGWGKLLWAAENTEPSKRWADQVEQVLLDKERSTKSIY